MSEQFPSEWLQLHLGDIVEYGKALKAKANEIEDDTWILELEDIEKNTSVILKKIIFKDRQTKSTKNKFKKGDVLYGKLRPYLNKVVVAESDGVCSTEILPLSGNTGLKSKYLFYWLKHPIFLEYVTKVGYGVNMPRLGTKDGKQAPFIYVPLAEQKQIVTQLDNLLAQVDTLKNRLDEIPVLLKRFRQSVLATAVSGKLTEDWKENDTQIKKDYDMEVSIGHKQNKKIEVTSNHDVVTNYFPKHWYVSDFNELYCFIDYRGKTPKKTISGTRLITAKNIRMGYLNDEPIEYMSNEDYKKWMTRGFPKANDILFVTEGHTMGFVALNTRKDIFALAQRTLTLQPYGKVNPKFHYYYMMSNSFQKVVALNATGTAAKGIKAAKFRGLPLPFPSYGEQTEIVTRVENLFAFADKIENSLKQAQEQANKLTPSLLAKAFRGELTTDWRKQNPDLITGKNSAEALLARIKAEQKKLKPKHKIRKKKA